MEIVGSRALILGEPIRWPILIKLLRGKGKRIGLCSNTNTNDLNNVPEAQTRESANGNYTGDRLT